MTPEKTSAPRFIQIANRYLERGGEDSSVDRIYATALRHGMAGERILPESRAWKEPGAPSSLGQLLRSFYNPATAARLRGRIEACHPDFLLTHNLFPVASPSAYATALRAPVPIIQYFHNWRAFSITGSFWKHGSVPGGRLRNLYPSQVLSGEWHGSRIKSLVKSLVFTTLYRTPLVNAVQSWICISEFMRDKFIEAGWPQASTFALRHSWDAMKEPPPAADKGSFVFLGRLIEEKGVRLLIQLWRDRFRKPESPKLVICGSGPLEENVARAAAECANIIYQGQVGGEQKAELIRTARALLSPALWWEPLGLTPYEAYDNNKPILAAASGGLTETVIHNETGLLHKPGDMAELAKQVEFINNNPAEAARMGTIGRKWLLENASPEKWFKEFSQIVEITLETHRNRRSR